MEIQTHTCLDSNPSSATHFLGGFGKLLNLFVA